MGLVKINIRINLNSTLGKKSQFESYEIECSQANKIDSKRGTANIVFHWAVIYGSFL